MCVIKLRKLALCSHLKVIQREKEKFTLYLRINIMIRGMDIFPSTHEKASADHTCSAPLSEL